ncbi:MAG TPA: DUF4190 domain-containing protein [Nocardioidaceae bacterium]|nr:DUF4190 domain-containing protein [Nocardioidaceae bacterium]
MSYPPGPPEGEEPDPHSEADRPSAPPPPPPGQPYGYGTAGYPPGPSGGQYPPQPPPGYYGPGGAFPETNGKATGALVTGIATLVLSWCCGAGILGIIAVLLGVRARSEIRDSGGRQGGDGMALAGIITGAVAIVIGVLVVIAIIIVIAAGRYDMPSGGTRL